MKVVELVRDVSKLLDDTIVFPALFRVGKQVIEGGYTVSSILYCRDGYSNGIKGKRPSYAIKFSDSNEVRIIPESEVVDISVVEEKSDKSEKKSITEEAALELPE